MMSSSQNAVSLGIRGHACVWGLRSSLCPSSVLPFIHHTLCLTRTRPRSNTRTHKHTQTHTHMHSHIHTHIYTHTHSHTHTCTHACTQIHTCTLYTHTLSRIGITYTGD